MTSLLDRAPMTTLLFRPVARPDIEALVEAGRAGDRATSLDFVMEHQQQSEWCWSATATSVALYYDPISTWNQCRLVNEELDRQDCCQNGSGSSCNEPWFLDLALTRVHRLQRVTAAKKGLAEVKSQIDAGHVLCVRIGWDGGGGHFVAIVGYDETAETLDVRDPWFGTAYAVPYSSFPESYQSGGDWTHSYETG